MPVLRGATQIGTGAVEVRLRCPAGSPGECRGAIVLDHAENGGRPHRAGSARYRLAPGERGAVTVPLSPAWRRALRARGQLAVRVSAGQTYVGSPTRMVAATQPRTVLLRTRAGSPTLPTVTG